jgi:hypothetical protein
MCIHAMKENNINKVYFSTNDGTIECMKVNDIVPDHISYGAIASMNTMSNLNQYLIFGFTLNIFNIDRKNKRIIKES